MMILQEGINLFEDDLSPGLIRLILLLPGVPAGLSNYLQSLKVSTPPKKKTFRTGSHRERYKCLKNLKDPTTCLEEME